jgi:hypothetical protein
MVVMARTTILETADQLLGGAIADEWLRQKAENGSYETFGRWLAQEHGIKVSAVTVGTWARSIGAPSLNVRTAS